MTTPNVPSCGCKIENYLAFNDTGIPEHYRSERIKYCELHASAKEMREALKLAIGFCVAFRQDNKCWNEHQDVGVLYSKLSPLLELISRAEKGRIDE